MKCDHREHKNLLSRERVNKGTKSINSLPLSLVVLFHATFFSNTLICNSRKTLPSFAKFIFHKSLFAI